MPSPFLLLNMNNIDIGRSLGLTIKHNKIKEWTQDFVPVTAIRDGVVIIEDDRGRERFIKILEVNAVNFAIMSPIEQDRLIMNYMRSLRSGPSNFQIKIVTKPTDIEEYVSAAKKALAEETDVNCKALISNYINYLVGEAGMQTYKRHYYFIFEYEPPLYGNAPTTTEGVITALNEKAQEIIGEFRSIGNKIYVSDNEDYDLCVLLYDYYNRAICRMENFQSRVDRISRDIKKINRMQENDRMPDVDFKTLLAPKGIDFNESPNYMIIGGEYRAHYFIPGDRIPTYISTVGGWLNELSNFGEGFDVDIFFSKESSEQKLNSIRTNLKFSSNNLDQTAAEAMNADEVVEEYSAAMFMKKALGSGGEEIYEMSVMLTTYASTLEDLTDRKAYIKKRSVQMDVPILECKRFQEDAFDSTGFFVELTPKMFNLTHRNITSSGVAAAYPFTSFSLTDPNGIAIGYHRGNRSLIMLDLFAPHYANANISLYGASGHGKTFALLTLTSRLRFHGIQQFILSPDKQDEFRRICEALGGVFVDISASSNQRINLFEIVPMDSPEKELLGGESYVEKSWLTDKVETVGTWCNYLIRDLSYAEKVRLQQITVDMYSEFGITEDNDSIYEDKEAGKIKKMPAMSDFYERVKADTDLRSDILIILSQFVTGAARSMNGQTNVDLKNKYIVFGLENIKDELLAPTMFIILQYVWGKCRQNKTERKLISIDEGWKLLDKNNPLVGAFVERIFKVIRGYGGGALFATQSIVDLYSDGSNFGNAILSCSHSKIILGMEQKDLNMLSEELGLSPTEASQIIGAEPGEALLCAGSNHIPIKIEASAAEYKLFTTRRSDLEQLIKEMNQQ